MQITGEAYFYHMRPLTSGKWSALSAVEQRQYEEAAGLANRVRGAFDCAFSQAVDEGYTLGRTHAG